MTMIKGPDGNAVDVDDKNRLSVFSVTQKEDKHLNTEGGAFSVDFSVTPAGANDYFFYLKNTGLKDLFMTDIRISSSVPTTLFYEHVSGTPVFAAEADAGITSRKLGSASELQVDAKFDTDITGLTSLGNLFFEECAVADVRYKLSTSSNIIIPQGQAVAFRRVAATGTITAVVSVAVSE